MAAVHPFHRIYGHIRLLGRLVQKFIKQFHRQSINNQNRQNGGAKQLEQARSPCPVMGGMVHGVHGNLQADGIHRKAEADGKHHDGKEVNPGKTASQCLADDKDGSHVHRRTGHEHNQCRSRREPFHDKGRRHRNAAGGADVHGNGNQQNHQHLQQGLRAEAQEKAVRHRHLDEGGHQQAQHQASADILYHVIIGIFENPPKAVSAVNAAGCVRKTVSLPLLDKAVYQQSPAHAGNKGRHGTHDGKT